VDDPYGILDLPIQELNREVARRGLLRDVHFDYDRYNLRSDARDTLRSNASFLLQYPMLEIKTEGHCDERGTEEYNLALGDKRARSANLYLVRAGVDAGRLLTISFGEERPVDPRSNEEAWQRNRRAHFVIVGK
jgi:peptidoglycan-associated lipoprotein